MSGPSTPFASASLYVGDLNEEVTEALLFEKFNAVGPVASVRVCRDVATRRSLGYAYVNFHRIDDAERALDTMNFVHIRGQPCRIMWSQRDTGLRKSGRGNIFVKNLAKIIDNKSLYDTFSMFGNILSCKVATNGKESLGYGFVHYENEDSAANAIARVNGKIIAGQQVEVTAFQPKDERPNARNNFTNLFIKSIPLDWNSQTFADAFATFGTITSHYLALDNEGKSKGYGFINFGEPEEAAAALKKMNGLEVAPGTKLFVGRAMKKSEREKELRNQFESLKIQRQSNFQGVNLYIKNLTDNIDDETLRGHFMKFGDILSGRVKRKNGRSMGFGFVCFANADAAKTAIQEMNGKMIDGKPWYVNLAQPKNVRRAQLELQFSKAKIASRSTMMPQGLPPNMTPQPMYYQGIPGAYPNPMNPHSFGQAQPLIGPYPGQMPGVPTPMMRPPYPMMIMNNRGRPQVNPMLMKPQHIPPPQQQVKYATNARNLPGTTDNFMKQQPVHTNVQTSQVQSQVPSQTMQNPNATISIADLAHAPEKQKKQMIGEKLYPAIKKQQPALAGKITGMLLEMDNGELLHLLESSAALDEKVQEALQVLQEHQDAEGQ